MLVVLHIAGAGIEYGIGTGIEGGGYLSTADRLSVLGAEIGLDCFMTLAIGDGFGFVGFASN
jgi:hypothetical protein